MDAGPIREDYSRDVSIVKSGNVQAGKILKAAHNALIMPATNLKSCFAVIPTHRLVLRKFETLSEYEEKRMNQILSACGLLCNECNYYINNTCQGCHMVKGSTFWAQESMPDKICPLYKCAIIDKKYKNCGQCIELPCKKFTDLKDPNITDEQHIQSVNKRISRLR
jgi:hypothetical protein